ncbi:MAG: hypothetical protein FWH53_11210 [Leptospirales bacterium]|nr:hypothetical protein [Leptospirales bacterium]
MAGYSFNDLSIAPSHEEEGLKQTIAAAWETMKRTNWDDTKFCTVNPPITITYSMAKSFQSFFNNEGWNVVVKRSRSRRNYYFDVYHLE